MASKSERRNRFRGIGNYQFLGEYDYQVEERDEIHRRRFYHLGCEEFPGEIWQHNEEDPSDGKNESIRFELYWSDLGDALPDLIAEHDKMLPELLNRLRA